MNLMINIKIKKKKIQDRNSVLIKVFKKIIVYIIINEERI